MQSKILVWTKYQSVYTAHLDYETGTIRVLKDGAKFMVWENLTKLQLKTLEKQIQVEGIIQEV